MRLRITFEVDDGSIHDIIAFAIRLGYLRVDPRKAWSEAEYKDAIRYLVRYLLGAKNVD